MTTANSTQVGGSHYRTVFQHWDLAHLLNLGYFEGQITKYTTRHANKNGLQDVQKAIHFLQKLIELEPQRQPMHAPRNATVAIADYRECPEDNPRARELVSGVLAYYCTSNALSMASTSVIHLVCTWHTSRDLTQAMEVLRLIEQGYTTEPTLDGDAYRGGPTPEYVNQDR